MDKPKVISATNPKGGVGKSITVYNLGTGLAMDGKNSVERRGYDKAMGIRLQACSSVVF